MQSFIAFSANDLAVYIAAMAYTHNKDDQPVMVHVIDDAVIANPDSVVTFGPMQFLHTRRKGLLGKGIDGFANSKLD